MVLFILFTPYSYDKNIWYYDDKNNKTDFVKRLKKIGNIYIDNEKRYKFEDYSVNLYQKVSQIDNSFIPIGLEESNYCAFNFANKYSSQCIGLFVINNRFAEEYLQIISRDVIDPIIDQYNDLSVKSLIPTFIYNRIMFSQNCKKKSDKYLYTNQKLSHCIDEQKLLENSQEGLVKIYYITNEKFNLLIYGATKNDILEKIEILANEYIKGDDVEKIKKDLYIYCNKYIKYKIKYLNKLKIDSKTRIITNDNTKLIPVVSKTNKLLTFDFPEISIASVQYNEGPTGCTYIRFNNNKAVFYCDRRGGYVTTALSDHVRLYKNNIRGICLTGGSFLGVEAISGCIAEELKNINYINYRDCYIIGGTLHSANLYYNRIYPNKKLGRFAVNNVEQNKIYLGQAGAGCMAGNGYYGQGASFRTYKGVKIFALSAVNAAGAIYNEQGQIIRDNKNLYNEDNNGKNTTLTIVITDLSLNYFELEQLSIQCHTNMAVVIKPFNTVSDGDVLFGVSLNEINRENIKNFEIKEFYKICSEMTNDAVLNCFN